MKTIKVIDLLNKIANGEEVPHFKVGEIEYFLNWRGNLLEREEDKPSADAQWYIDKIWLNTEAEIIEEDKKIEKITLNDIGTIGFPNGQWTARNMDKAFAIKINEIIDKLNEMSDKSE